MPALLPLHAAIADAHFTRQAEEEIGLPPAQVLFLSDIREELDAAREAGMRTVHLIRPPQPLQDAGHPAVADFDAIVP